MLWCPESGLLTLPVGNGDSTGACQPHLPISLDGSQDRLVTGFCLPFQALIPRRHSCSASQAPSESPDKCSRSCRDQGCADLESWLRCPWSLSPSLVAMTAITRPLLYTYPQTCPFLPLELRESMEAQLLPMLGGNWRHLGCGCRFRAH